MDPSNLNKVLKPMNCLSCHQPHSSVRPNLLVKDQANNMTFCITCHTNLVGPGAPSSTPDAKPQAGAPQTTQPPAAQLKAPEPTGKTK
jgi:predicted CXXCH cytochrome family protein